MTTTNALVSEAHAQALEADLTKQMQHAKEVAAFATRLAAALPTGPIPSDVAARLLGAVAVYASQGGPET